MIPLQPFIEILTEAHNSGLDYIDIIGTINVVQDFIGISYNETYYCKTPRTKKELYIEYEEGYDPVPVPNSVQDFENLASL
jgi:hypothetical protein